MTMIHGVLCLDAHVIYERKTLSALSVVTLQWGVIMGTNTVVRDRRQK